MSKIDLSKAKVGDKFRTRDGHIMVYISRARYILDSGQGEYVLTTEEEFPIHNEDGNGWTKLSFYYFSDGTGNDGLPFDASNVLQSLRDKTPMYVPYGYELIEQVFDDKKDTTDLEIVEAMNQAINENSKKAAEREKELQRRQKVVELARKMLFDDNTYQFYTQFYVRAKQNEGAEQVKTYLQYVMDYAEDCVNKFNQYLKEGKLC